MNYRIERINDRKPLITCDIFAKAGIPDDGSSINGPSVVAVPEWVPENRRADPCARYYLYFAHHGGRYIRMAWAESIMGPYRLYNSAPCPSVQRGVLALPETDGIPLLRFENGVEITSHIASPNVHVDDANRQFVLYFHGETNSGTPRHSVSPQKTFVATSATGLNFNRLEDGGEPGHGPWPAVLGNAYFCVFAYAGYLYAFSNGGELWRVPVDRAWLPKNPPFVDSWERGPNPVSDALTGAEAGSADPRHFAVRFLDPDRIEVFFSLRGDIQESIERMEMDIGSGDWSNWRATALKRLLSPEEPWEGAGYRAALSRAGGQTGVRQLRDPAVFTDVNESAYLFYCGAGEEGIGIAAMR